MFYYFLSSLTNVIIIYRCTFHSVADPELNSREGGLKYLRFKYLVKYLLLIFKKYYSLNHCWVLLKNLYYSIKT